MIELRLLGATDLGGLPAAAAEALLAQPKRIAMLAYLALAQPRGYHRRDRIVGLLWPELDQERARVSLRRAVYDLRRALGDDVIVGRGDEEIALARDAVWCDAVDADESVDAGRYLRALELYKRGDLLPGFFVQDAGAFEDWLERTRSMLRDKMAAAAWSLAAESASGGQLTNSNRFARRASELAPSDERMLRRVMQLLAEHGDVAGALHVYDDFARRLRRDFDAEPSRESRELVERMRREGR
ncbi:transcriptional activator domain-containing protein (plasmid) [Gemmatirosa kalamazoonensis]|jgi:serine/threonine-protein kinase|uniref:Transcriptional activator domain-containing protein n=1 Tax=Gemmatirosa kalamazoonensis TaxID=861299 RepID=W0RN95_9BACT|nr:BTAD domain-containing putative transcriptional regulator [Gemmatirosa kalamazoonensis]AHG92504.1 transcriptional activator domain-containing protein [Gemmatirosa kalamazoonensis]